MLWFQYRAGSLTTWGICDSSLFLVIYPSSSAHLEVPLTTILLLQLLTHIQIFTSLSLVTVPVSCSQAAQLLFLRHTASASPAGLLASTTPDQRRIHTLPLHLLPAPAALARIFGTEGLVLRPPLCLSTGTDRARLGWQGDRSTCWAGAPCRSRAMLLHRAQHHILHHLSTVQIFSSSSQIAELGKELSDHCFPDKWNWVTF